MEYFALPQLTKMISHFPRDGIGAIIQQLAGAAKFLETRGIAHRDIKPDNIVITRNCQNATLLDLGVILPIAGADGNDAGTGEAFLGTTRYSLPEYVMREEEESELGSVTFYQLGAVLHDMIMRDRLFGNVQAPPARLIDAVRHIRPVVDAEGVSPQLLALARNCLQKDWRLRLELVRWEHFTEVPAPTQAAEVKERIRRRISLGANPLDAAPVSGPVPGPPPRRLLEHIGGLIASVVREVCLQSGTFPPLDIRHSSVEDERHVCIRAGPSTTYALPVTLEIRISVSPLDADGLVLRLRGVAAIGAAPTDIGQGAWQPIYSGDGSAPALRERLDDFLHLALDAAHNAGGAVASPLLRLPLPQ